VLFLFDQRPVRADNLVDQGVQIDRAQVERKFGPVQTDHVQQVFEHLFQVERLCLQDVDLAALFGGLPGPVQQVQAHSDRRQRRFKIV
jgi:hypothetical protein